MTTTSENSEEFYAQVRSASALLLQRKTKEGFEVIEELQRSQPDAPEILYLMGLASMILEEYGRALLLLEEAHNRDPECYEYAEVLANLHVRVGNLAEGVYFAKLSTTLDPHPHIYDLIPPSLSNFFKSLEEASVPRNYAYGFVKLHQNDFEEAAREFDRQLMLVPDDTDALRDAAVARMRLGDFDRAIKHVQRAIDLAPDDPMCHFRAGQVCARIGAPAAAIYHFRKTLELETESLPVASAVLALAEQLPGDYGDDLKEIAAEVKRRTNEIEPLPPEATPSNYRKKRIHVGYITNDSWNPDSAAFLGSILELQDITKFDVTLYQQTQGHAAFIQQLNNLAETDRRLWELDDEIASVVICGDEIDILVNLCVPEQNNRASLFAMHPATIQVGCLGSNFGLKAPGITHVVGDALTAEALRPHLGEGQELITTGPSLWCLKPSYMLPEKSDLPALKSGGVTFGAHCDLSALTPEAVEAFTAALKEIPGSRLLFGAAGACDVYPAHRIAELFAETGVADRVSVWEDNGLGEKWIPDPSYWREVDIFLIPGPMNAPMRIADALWMGIPALTITGASPLTHVGASILASAVKLEWKHGDLSSWLDNIKELTADLDALAKIRETLRGEIKNTALFNPVARVRELEDLFVKLVDERDARNEA